jgi:hypothetical protein
MPTFRRNILSASSKAEVTRQPSISLLSHFSLGRWRQYVSPKRRHQPTYQHGTQTKKLKKSVRSLFLFPTVATFASIYLTTVCQLVSVSSLGRGSSVSIVSYYGLDDRAIEVRSPVQAKGFFSVASVSSPTVGSTQPPVQWVPGGPFPGGKARPGRDAGHSPSSSTEVVNELEL